ncbi:hypothetical protein [Caballeronia sordidicola]|uniref:hypothetical protein n=1 Tax=Caballeronia sordidicola TaxID=196367 RepID=UPI00211ADE2C|nr:hypothetical protein [Caballeronia sordidicola]
MMNLPRTVVAETLDGLREEDPVAKRSRRDLQRVHRVMGTRSIIKRAVNTLLASRLTSQPLRILELGAGDGTLLLGVAKALSPALGRVDLTLLDRQDLIAPSTVDGYSKLGWIASAEVVDVFDWIAGNVPSMSSGRQFERWDLIVANLFLHHFEDHELHSLLAAIAARGDRFLACEPRRAQLALVGSHLIGALGVNSVTRSDAVLSVRAGFCGDELSRLWPAQTADWKLTEYPAGLFSHCFSASHQ